MDRKTALAMILCLIIYLGWQKLYVEPRMHHEETSSLISSGTPSQGTPSSDSSKIQSAHSTPSQVTPEAKRPTAQQLVIPTGSGDAVLRDSGPIIQNWKLRNYKVALNSQAGAVDLQSVTHQEGELSLAFEDQRFAYLSDIQGQLSPTPQGAIWKYEDEKVKLTREILASDQKPFLDVLVKAEFKDTHPNYAFITLGSHGVDKDPEAQDRQLVYFTKQSIERLAVKEGMETKEIASPVRYIGATNRYFLLTAVSQGPEEPRGLVQPSGANAGRISFVYPIRGKEMTIPLRVYFGPKDLALLRQVDPTLDHTVDFGWFTVFAYPLLNVLKWLYSFCRNYGLAIVLLTLLLKIATFPLTYKSMQSMKKMAKLQPQLQRIREKHKDDKEALNREMLTIMKSHGYNPMAGCLPILIQMPIFFALYRVLYSSIELYHAPFMLWIHDLSSHDPFYVTPVLLSLAMFVQQKLTPSTATDPTQAKMMQLMPLIFGAFMLALPSGLTVYTLVNAIAGIVQQVILNKKLDAKPAR